MNKILFLVFLICFGFQANTQEPNDCVNAITVCGNGIFSSNAVGIGAVQEVSGCGGFENNSLWLEVNIVQAGTLGFDIIPDDPDIMVDYDFWVFGPDRICSNLGSPIRCATTNPNQAGLSNNHTGINGSTTLTQTGPGPNGNGYVFWLTVNVGELYYIVIDRPVGDGGFEMQWTGTAMDGSGAFPATPTANEIDDVKQCSSNPDISIFDLNGLKSSINADVGNTIDFYGNLADAVDDINELPGIYANSTNPQTIYAKVKSSVTDCYDIIDFDLIVTPIPDATLSVSSSAICEGESVVFTITGTPNSTVHYTIDGGSIEEVLLDASGLANITEFPIGNITLSLEDAQILSNSGVVVCSQSLMETELVTVTTNTIPVITSNSPICEGSDGELQFSGDPNATVSYTVNSGTPQTFNLDSTGNFTLSLPTLSADTDIEIISVTSAGPPNDCEQLINSIETIEVNPLPTVIAPDPLLACSDGMIPNSAPFDLDAESAAISNNEPNVTVTYYETQAQAETGNLADALISPYNSTSANQIIYVRVETDLACVNFTTLNLQVLDIPIANMASALQSCDDTGQGLGVFDLNQATTEIINGNTQPVQISFYTTQAEAEAGTPEIANTSAFQNTIPYNQTIYVRVDSDVTDCYSVVALNLEIFDTPVLNAINSLVSCDNLGSDETETFDLELQTSIVLGGLPNITVTYHFSQLDAENGVNPLSSPYSNTSNPQTIFVRAENEFNTDCFETTSFDLVVNPLPALVAPTPLEVCDDGVPDGLTSIDLTLKNQEITGNNPNYSVSYYLTQFDADNEINALAVPYTNISNPQDVFVRVEDINTGCYGTTSLSLVVDQAPIANTPMPLEYCDADSDGFGVFTLEDATNEITGGDASLTVSYHETMADAENNVNALGSPYNNIVENQQTIYVRVESATIATDCATLVELILIVNPTPQIEDPTPLAVCDDVSADGFAQFDLTSKDTEILDGLDPLEYVVSYYETALNAESGSNAILNSGNYTNTTAFSQILWVRVEDTANGCYKLTSLELIVNALPVLVQPSPLELCDDNNPGDEMEAFTLEDADAQMLAGQTGISFTYYETQLDADNGTNPIVSPYVNTSNPQTVFVRATDDVTGCFVSSTATILLRVNPIPSPASPTDLEVCDLDNDGFESFDLESRTLEIINGELDIDISYHETQSDADMGLNALLSPYTNIVMNQQMIYIRAENTITGCYNSSQTLTIRVLPSPEVPVAIDDYVICDTNSDGFAQFDLTTKTSEILGTQAPADFILTYHVSLAGAQSGNNPIANVTSYTNVTNPQTIYVRLVSTVNGCVTATGFFDIRVELPPEAIQPTPLQLCDDEIADEVTVFDLRVKDAEITGGDASWSVSYYETLADAQSGQNAVDADAYTNTSVNGAAGNPQTLYVVVTDTDTGCVDYTTLTIRVLPNPTPSLDPDDLELCDDINPGDMEEEFDLTANEAYIINGEPGVTVSYHQTLEDAELGLNAIVDPAAYTNTSTPQTIYVRVTNDITDCYTIVTFDLIVNPLPEVVAVTDFILCELNTDGIDEFDLTLKDAEVLNGQDPALFTVSYHATQGDADALSSALVSPYTNLTSPQQIFVAITNNATGCSISTPSFNIEVQEAAEANSDMEPIVEVICDDQMDDDGDLSNNSAQFDLTPATDAGDLDPTSVQAQVLDGQDPANYIVSYYGTQMDAELGVNPLPFLYENISNPQVIYVRVDNDTMIDDGTGNMIDSSICYAVAPLTLRVDPLPVFGLEQSYILCVDTNGTQVLNVPVLDTGLSAPGYEFEWSLNGTPIAGATQGSYEPVQGGVYSVIVTDAVTGCSSSAMTEVIESAPPTITLVDVTTDAFSELHIIEVTVTGPGDYEYSLDGGSWQDSNIFVDVSAGEHEIEVRDKIGCGQQSATITVMDYPKFFTPNGDGYHDTWNINGIADQPSAKIYIFDRYGKLLKQISPTSEGWNGTYNGSPMPTSDYWFVVEYNEPNTGERKEFKAHFTLKR